MKAGKVIHIVMLILISAAVGITLTGRSKWLRQLSAEKVSAFIGRITDGQATVGRISLLTPFGLSIDSITLCNPLGDTILTAENLTARMRIGRLLKNRLDFTSVSLVSPDIRLSKDSIDDEPNYRFLLDLLADTAARKEKKSPKVNVNSLAIRNGKVSYNIKDQEETPNLFNKFHIYVSGLDAHLSLHNLTADTADLHILDFKMRESSGFTIDKLSAHVSAGSETTDVNDFRLALPGTDIRIDGNIQGKGLDKGTVGQFSAVFSAHDSYISPSDLKAFIPQLASFSDRMPFGLDMRGSTDQLEMDRIMLESSEGEFRMEAGGKASNLSEYPSLDNAHILIRTDENLYKWLCDNTYDSSISIPEILSRFGGTNIELKGSGSVSGYDFTGGITSSSIGEATFLVSSDGKRTEAEVSSERLNMKALTGKAGLGSAGLHASAFMYSPNAPGISNGGADVRIPYIEYGGHKFRDIALECKMEGNRYNASADISDKAIPLHATAVYILDREELQTSVNLDGADLKSLGLAKSDSTSGLSLNMNADLRGRKLDDIRGRLTFNDISYTNDSGTYAFNSVEMIVRDVMDGKTMATVTGDGIYASILGRYRFSTLAGSMTSILSTSLPSLYRRMTSGSGIPRNTDNEFNIYATIGGNTIPEDIFHIPLRFDTVAILNMDVNDSRHTADMGISLPSVEYAGNSLTEGSFTLHNDGDTISFTGIGEADLTNGVSATFHTFLAGHNDRMSGLVGWETGNSGEFESNILGSVTFGPYKPQSNTLAYRVDLDNTSVTYKGSKWNISESYITADNGRYSINDLLVSHGNQYFGLEGDISPDSTDVVKLELKDIDLNGLLNLAGGKKPDISGIASGKVFSRGTTGRPIIYGDIAVGSLHLMGSEFDSTSISGKWNDISERIDLSAVIRDTIHGDTYAAGFYYPATDSIEFGFDAKHLDLRFLGSFIPEKVIKELSGNATTDNLKLYGTLKRMDIDGTALLEDGYFHITPNNCRYTVPHDTLRFAPGEMIFNNIDVFDEEGNTARMDMRIRHRNFKRIMVDLGLSTDRIHIFNIPKTESSTLSGDVVIGGTPRLTTRPGSTSISGNCRTSEGTSISLSQGVSNAGDYRFLTIKDKSTPLVANTAVPERNPRTARNGGGRNRNGGGSSLNVSLGVEINENARIYADMNSLSGSVYGNGNVDVKYDTNAGVNATGVYNITGGKGVLSLQQLLNREFKIDETQESRILFNGDIPNSTLDIHAYHPVNSVSLHDLDAGASSSRVKVNCVMDIDGQLSSPQISFSVELPQGSAEEKDIVASATSTEEQRNTQFMYLLALERFYTYDYSAGMFPAGETTTAMESFINSTINGQINNLLSQVINSNYISLSSNMSTGYLLDDQSNYAGNTFEGILEARLLDNRLIFNGNFGYKENALNNTSGFIGDFELKWLVLPKIGVSLLGYNRNNQRYFTKTTLNTQGIGVAYQTDFNNIRPQKSSK